MDWEKPKIWHNWAVINLSLKKIQIDPGFLCNGMGLSSFGVAERSKAGMEVDWKHRKELQRTVDEKGRMGNDLGMGFKVAF